VESAATWSIDFALLPVCGDRLDKGVKFIFVLALRRYE
jgi:hypothetical protein